MTAATLIRQAEASGVTLRIVDGKVKASGDRIALAAMVDQLRDHKAEIVELLADAHQTTAALIEAAMRVSSQYGDGEAAREQMRRDCLVTPQHLRADLLAHFTATYRAGKQ